MNPDKYIFTPKATSEETLDALINLLVADGLDEDDLTNKALSSGNHQIHSLAVMLYITGVELGRIPNGFDHSDAIYLDIAKTHIAKLGPQDPMSIMFRIYDEHINKAKPVAKTKTWKDEEVDELDTEDLEVGIYAMINQFLDFVTDEAKLDENDLRAFREAARQFAKTEATKSAIMEQSNAHGVLAINPYDGDITVVVSNILDEFKRNGITPDKVYKSKEQFDAAGGTYANYMIPIVEFELRHNRNMARMRDAATDDLNLMEHILGGIQKFANLDPLGLALQMFKKAVLDPNM